MKRKQLLCSGLIVGMALAIQGAIGFFTMESTSMFWTETEMLPKWLYLLLWASSIAVLLGEQVHLLYKQTTCVSAQLLWYLLQLSLFGMIAHSMLNLEQYFAAMTFLCISIYLTLMELYGGRAIYLLPFLWQLALFLLLYRCCLNL